jgi:hypothetical protein
VRVTTLSGRTLITSDFPLRDPALDATRYLAECGPAVQTNAYSSVLWRVEGLGRVPVGLTFLDHQGRRLNPGRPHQKAELSGVGPLATASAWAFAMPLAQAHTVLVQLGAAANHESTAPSLIPPSTPIAPITPPAGFGPVIERVLDFDTSRKTANLDLDTGEYVDPGTNSTAWQVTPADVDLASSFIESNFDVRWAINMSVVPVEPMRWEATPEEIRMAVDSAKRQPKIRLGDGRSTNTWFFQTSEGGRGILQFLPPKAGDDPSQVRLRYRLVEASSSQTDGPGAR